MSRVPGVTWGVLGLACARWPARSQRLRRQTQRRAPVPPRRALPALQRSAPRDGSAALGATQRSACRTLEVKGKAIRRRHAHRRLARCSTANTGWSWSRALRSRSGTPLTSREFKLIGPGHYAALPRHGAEQMLVVADGELTTAANLGVRPGAEVLIATPEGTVHFGDAALDFEYGPKGLRRARQTGGSLARAGKRSVNRRSRIRCTSGAEARVSGRRTLDPSSAAGQPAKPRQRHARGERGAACFDPTANPEPRARSVREPQNNMRDSSRRANRLRDGRRRRSASALEDSAERQRLVGICRTCRRALAKRTDAPLPARKISSRALGVSAFGFRRIQPRSCLAKRRKQ